MPRITAMKSLELDSAQDPLLGWVGSGEGILLLFVYISSLQILATPLPAVHLSSVSLEKESHSRKSLSDFFGSTRVCVFV